MANLRVFNTETYGTSYYAFIFAVPLQSAYPEMEFLKNFLNFVVKWLVFLFS
jgi:hypothetical protein